MFTVGSKWQLWAQTSWANIAMAKISITTEVSQTQWFHSCLLSLLKIEMIRGPPEVLAIQINQGLFGNYQIMLIKNCRSVVNSSVGH